MLHLLNATIIPIDGVFRVTTVADSEARDLFWNAMAHDGSVFSHIGHEATASVMSAVLNHTVAVDRTPWDGSGWALVLQLKQRGPEGRILTVEEMLDAGCVWRVIEKVEEQ